MRTFKNIESYLIIRADTLYRIIVTILAGLVMVASSMNGEHITSVIYYGSLTLSLAAFGNSWSICIISWAVSEASLMFYYFVTDSGYETVLLTSLTSIVILAVAFPVRKSLGIGDMDKPFKINWLLVAGALAGFLVTLSSRGDLSIWKAIISLWLMLPIFIAVARIIYNKSFYIFQTTYIILMFYIIHMSNAIGSPMTFELIEYVLLMTSLITGVVYRKLRTLGEDSSDIGSNSITADS